MSIGRTITYPNGGHVCSSSSAATVRRIASACLSALFLLLPLACFPARAEALLRAQPGSWHPTGIFCCKITEGGAAEVRVFKLNVDKPEMLFAKEKHWGHISTFDIVGKQLGHTAARTGEV